MANSPARLKIGLVFDDSLDRTDGVAQYVLTLGAWLASQKHEVHYLVGETKRSDLPNLHSLSRNIRVRFNQNRLSMPLPASGQRLRALLHKERFDLLHVQMPYSPALAGRIIRATDSNTPIVGTFHVLPASKIALLGNHLLATAQKRTLSRFNGIISNSKPTQDFVKKVYGLSSQLIPLGVEVAHFCRAQPLKKYQKGTNVVFLGRLVERKGCLLLLKAVAKLVREAQWPAPARVLVCGDGPQRLMLQEYVHQQGLNDIVQFVGFVAEASKPRYLASADVVALPSLGGESFGIVVVEALAAARGTVLAGDNPGYRAVLHERPGQLFDPRDTDNFAALLLLQLANTKERRANHAWQQQYVQRFDIGLVGQKTLDFYRHALQQVKK